ncbi:MAG: dimethyl sulfoxide reductase anchor subunit [Alphaproteobacteria bacterium]|nr:MAG: dimethyl sulfoxide reductase anchor subunit [Alphaproteobacteria bacterium]
MGDAGFWRLNRVHPALSVILFTSLSGMGYGAAVWLALFHLAPAASWMTRGNALAVLAIAMLLIAGGLMASLFHLGHPERAWRAFSQWRSSWLSREGVLATATFAPLGLAGLLMLGLWPAPMALRLALLLAAAGALATVYASAMIYASLAAVPAWSNLWVRMGFPLYAVGSGGVLFLALAGVPSAGGAAGLTLALAAALFVKLASWRHNDRLRGRYRRESALGLAGLGRAHVFERPHAQANYLEREMAFTPDPLVKAALRWTTLACGFVLPALLIWLRVALTGLAGYGVGTMAAILCLAGMLAERWLFFAEAEHVMRLYYDRQAV